MKLIFAVLYVSSTMGLTRCYKTEGFTFILVVFLPYFMPFLMTLVKEAAKFQSYILEDTILREGGRISHFLIGICMGLTRVQLYCAACDYYYYYY